jgi:hypothetical protein
MERLNLTLDPPTSAALARHAKRTGKPRATVARELIGEALQRRDQIAKMRKLAHDYAAGRPDAAALLADLERPQLDLLEQLEDA